MQKKYYQILFLKDLKKSENIFIFDFGIFSIFRKYFSDFDISDFDISNFQKTKSKNFRFFRFWKMKIFSDVKNKM